jgi:hypothetical protein
MKNSFTSKITSGTSKFQVPILNQKIMITHPLKFLIVAYRYRNPFYIEWVSYHTIFEFSLTHEILKLGSNLYHRLVFRSHHSSFIQTVQKCTTGINTTREVETYLILASTTGNKSCAPALHPCIHGCVLISMTTVFLCTKDAICKVIQQIICFVIASQCCY